MPIALTAQRIRFAVDASNPFAVAPANVLNAQQLTIPSGSSVDFELQFYFQVLADATLLDLSQFSEIILSVQDNSDPHSGSIFFSTSVAASFFAITTTAQWLAGTAQQVLVSISSAENVIPPAATSYWLVIYGVSTDPAADNVLLFASNIRGKDSGIPSGVASLSAAFKAGAKLSFVCADGLTRDLTLQETGGVWNAAINQVGYNGPGQASFSLFCSDALWRDLTLSETGGQWLLAINQNGHT